MYIDFTKVLMEIDGLTPVLTPENQPFTLQLACQGGLLNSKRPLTGEQKIADFDFAKRIQANGELELKAEEIVLLKERIADAFSAVIVKRSWDILDPKTDA